MDPIPGVSRNELGDLFRLMADDPLAAATRLDEMARRLKELADALRANVGSRDTPGTGDRCQMAVVGPDGTMRQRTDTDRRAP